MKTLLSVLLLFPLLAVGQFQIEKAKTLYESKKYVEAAKLLEQVDDESKDYAAAQFYLGRIAFDQKEYDDAADYFEEASENDEKVADYFLWLGDTYGTIAKDANVVRQGFLAPKMKTAWEKCIALDAKNISARESLIEFYTQAPGFMGGSFEKAKEVANQIVKLNPAQGHRSMGDIFVREKNPTAAEKEYLEMVKSDEKFISVLGNFYAGQKQYDKAFNLFEEPLKKDPNNMIMIYLVGRTSAVSGQRLDRGEQCLKQYLSYKPKEGEPSHAGANMRLAQVYEKRGNKPEAKKLFETALKLDSNLKEAKEGLERVSK
ncbi:MAG TPA: tetratricopeptide repeat protein [Cyclobacteriaceae bacterium]|nr:tetratricopeptide repeat protein [Cyclobacteriaceae bacterium]